MPAVLHLQTKGKGDDASSTTEEEFEDNMWLIVTKFIRDTGVYPLLSYDNVKIQKGVNISNLKYAQGQEGKPIIRLSSELHKVDLPTYSPDMNRVIEHTFGVVKQRVRVQIYQGARDFSKGAQLQTAVVQTFDSLKRGSIKNDTKGLPLLWRVLSTAEGATFEQPPHHKHVGTGGGYAPARYC